MSDQAAAQLFLYFSIAFNSRLISYLLIVSPDLRVILCTDHQAGCVFHPSNYKLRLSGVSPLSVPFLQYEFFNGPTNADALMSHQSPIPYPLETRHIDVPKTMSQNRPDEEHPSNDDTRKALGLSVDGLTC